MLDGDLTKDVKTSIPLIIIMQKFNNFCVRKSRGWGHFKSNRYFLNQMIYYNTKKNNNNNKFLLIFYTFFGYIFLFGFFIVAANVNSLRAWNFRSFPFISQNNSPLLVAFESHSNVVDILLTDNFRTESKPIQTESTMALAILWPRLLHWCRWKKNWRK